VGVTAAELTITAALGASLLTGLASLGVVWLQEWRRSKARDRAALHTAVTIMLSRSLAFSLRARFLGLQMQLRSGLSEGVDVTLRLRKPADVLDLHDWLAADLAPLDEAWSAIWARGDQEMIWRANDLLSKCRAILDVSTSPAEPGTARERIRRWAIGVRWTPGMQADLDRALEEMAHARKRLADHVRSVFGRDAVELFTRQDVDAGQQDAGRRKKPVTDASPDRPPSVDPWLRRPP
jgi:hypothetical protein